LPAFGFKSSRPDHSQFHFLSSAWEPLFYPFPAVITPDEAQGHPRAGARCRPSHQRFGGEAMSARHTSPCFSCWLWPAAGADFRGWCRFPRLMIAWPACSGNLARVGQLRRWVSPHPFGEPASARALARNPNRG